MSGAEKSAWGHTRGRYSKLRVAERERRRVLVLMWLHKRGVTWPDEVICEGLNTTQVLGSLRSSVKAGYAFQDPDDEDAFDLTPAGREYVVRRMKELADDEGARQLRRVVASQPVVV